MTNEYIAKITMNEDATLFYFATKNGYTGVANSVTEAIMLAAQLATEDED